MTGAQRPEVRAFPSSDGLGRTIARPLALTCALAALATHCGPDVRGTPRSPEASVATSRRALAVSFFGPDDFSQADVPWSTIEFDQPVAPSRKSVIVVVPGTRVSTLVPGEGGSADVRVPVENSVTFDISVNTVDAGRKLSPWPQVPPVTRPTLSSWPPSPPGHPTSIHDVREFRIGGARILGRKAFESDPFVFTKRPTSSSRIQRSSMRPDDSAWSATTRHVCLHGAHCLRACPRGTCACEATHERIRPRVRLGGAALTVARSVQRPWARGRLLHPC
jgi:hypothetical protein